jgi:hypothetical protein
MMMLAEVVNAVIGTSTTAAMRQDRRCGWQAGPPQCGFGNDCAGFAQL